MTKRNIGVALFILFSMMHLVVGFSNQRVPAWGMFARLPSAFDYRLQDRHGNEYRIEDIAPGASFAPMSKKTLLNAPSWLDEHRPEGAPHTIFIFKLTDQVNED